MRQALRRLAVAALALIGLSLGALGLAYPILPASLCPVCFGLTRLPEGLIVEADSPGDWQAALAARVASAQAHVDAELGRPQSRRTVIACHTHTCAEWLRTDGAFGLALSTPFGAVVYIAPGADSATILRHELAHVAIHGHAGLAASLNGALPAWLDEGLAVIVSDDPAHLRPGTGPARCAAPPEPLIVSPFDFARAARVDQSLYTSSACAALLLEAQLGGRAALLKALGRLRQGEALPALVLR